MKNKMLAFLLTGAMALSMTSAVFAGETEASTEGTDSPYAVMQGVDADNTAWTILFNLTDPSAPTATVAASASTDDVAAITGDLAFDTDNGKFTITDSEGTVSTFLYKDETACTSSFASENGKTSFTCSAVDPTISEVINDYIFYTGLDSEGDSRTIGFNSDMSYMLFGFKFADGSDQAALAWQVKDVQKDGLNISATVVSDEGDEYPITIAFADDSAITCTISFDGEEYQASLVNPGVFPEFDATQSQTEG